MKRLATICAVVALSFGLMGQSFAPPPLPLAYQLAGYADNINCNATGDTKLSLAIPSALYRIAAILVYGVSGTVSGVQVGLYTGASQGGVTLLTQTALTPVTATGPNTSGAVAALSGATAGPFALNLNPLYFNVGTAEGSACVINVYLYVSPLP